MKILSFPRGAVLCVALFLGLAAEVRALPPSHRSMTGTIERLDRSNRILAVRGTDASSAMSFAWNERTRFVVSWRFADVAALHVGDTVVLTSRKPFFEERFAKKVVVVASGGKTGRPRK